MQDLRYALRSFRRQPIFTLVVVLTLTLGIGANTAIFSLLYQILLRPLPYPDAGRLVFIWNTYPLMALPQAAVSIPDYIDRKTQAPGLEDAALMTGRSLNLAEGGRPDELRALAVTPTFFTTLRRWPFLGRPFREEEAKPGNDKFAILTYGLWASRFGGDRAIIGREVRLSGETYSIVGVLPADFELPVQRISVLVPFAFTPEQMSDQGRGNEFSQMIARLKPGATIEQVNAEMKTIVDRNLQRLPERRAFAQTSGFGGYAVAMRDQLVGDMRTPLYVLQAAVLVVLLIACANVANLMLMRATGRHRELAVRVAMGAGQARLVRQLLTESVVLSIAGGVGGVVVGFALVRGLLAASSQQLAATASASLHPVVLLATLALSVVTGLAFGLVPALSVSRSQAGSVLKDDNARASAGRGVSTTRSVLVVAEMALALVLLVAAGLLIKSFARLQEVNPGFSTESVLTAQITLPDSRYADPTVRGAFWARLIDKVQTIPGVIAAGLTTNVPFNGRISSGSYTIVGYTPGSTEAQPHGRQEMVGGDYFRAMHIPLVAGRLFDRTDTIDSPLAVIVDEYLVKRYFAGSNPIGQQIRRGGTATFTIVGVVGTINSIDLGQPVTKERLYYPVTQRPAPSMAIVLKTGLDPQQLVGQVRGVVQSIDPEQPIADVRTLDEWVGRSLETRRLPMILLVLFGSVALVLAAIGLYGVLAFGVTERGREFGIRQALGADARSILALVLASGLRTAAIGIAIGLFGAFALAGVLSNQLYGVAARDAGVFGGVAATLLAVATAACLIPARRATRVDPAVTLRET